MTRNRLKRQLRETWTELAAVVEPGRDYVLVVRQGLAEPAEVRDHAWLAEQVSAVLGKAAT